jgi:hypothetical protein
MQDILNPPDYCPDALATDIGWINPRNGELLISIRNLRQKIAERDKAVQYRREHDPSETEKMLQRLTEITIRQKQPDDRSETQKMLDRLTDIQKPSNDEQSPTHKMLDRLTDIQTENAKMARNITVDIQDTADVKESVSQPAPRKRGRPRKQTNVTNND